MAGLSQILGRALPLHVIDVGAASMGKEGDPYHALLGDPAVHVTGFEPRAEACAERNAGAPPHHRYLPYFIADGTARDFHVCANPLTSSLYKPNDRLLSLFHNLHLPVVETSRVETKRLDDLPEIAACDLLKIDVQGAELDVLQGGARVAGNALVVDVEVEFVPMYEGQALFGDIDVHLRGLGFMLHRFTAPFSRQMRPLVFGTGPFGPGSQLLYAEAAVYIRAIDKLDSLSNDRLLAFARIMHDVYRSFDVVGSLIDLYDKRTGGDFLARYKTALAAPG